MTEFEKAAEKEFLISLLRMLGVFLTAVVIMRVSIILQDHTNVPSLIVTIIAFFGACLIPLFGVYEMLSLSSYVRNIGKDT